MSHYIDSQPNVQYNIQISNCTEDQLCINQINNFYFLGVPDTRGSPAETCG